MSEAAFWKSLKKTLKGERIQFQRFEDMLSEGIPDSCFFINSVTQWVELKYKKLPKRETTIIKVGIRPAQRIWHRKAIACNINCFILTKLDNGDVLLHSSKYIDELYFGVLKSDLYNNALIVGNNIDIINYIKENK